MKIKGKEILDFPISENAKEKYIGDFEVIIEKKLFNIELNDKSIAKFYFYKNLEGEKVHADYLMCRDYNGESFTLYDCYIWEDRGSNSKLWIIWKRLLYGQHIKQDLLEKIRYAEYVIELPDNKATYRLYIGKTNFDIFDGKISIYTDWNQEGNSFNGVKICVICKQELYTIGAIQEIVLRLMEIYFLVVGFFANVLQRKMITEAEREILYYANYASYVRVKKQNIYLPHVLELKKKIDYSKMFMEWWAIRKKEVYTFNLFAYTVSDPDPILEVPTATYIQCLEGYFRMHHADALKRFPSETKDKFIDLFVKYMDNEKDFLLICEEYDIDVQIMKNRIKGKLGDLSNMNLADVLTYAMEYCIESKKLFEYERSTLTENKGSLWKKFRTKAVGHRNWLSHLISQNSRFHDEEIELASSKLKLLFRLSLLKDIGAEITEESIDNVVRRINNWYDKYTLN